MEVEMARFDLTDFEWSVIQPLLPNKPRGVPRVDDRRVLNGIVLAAAHRRALGRHSGALRPAYGLREPGSTGGARPASGTAYSKLCQRLTTATFR
jgi:hypothetical protein